MSEGDSLLLGIDCLAYFNDVDLLPIADERVSLTRHSRREGFEELPYDSLPGDPLALFPQASHQLLSCAINKEHGNRLVWGRLERASYTQLERALRNIHDLQIEQLCKARHTALGSTLTPLEATLDYASRNSLSCEDELVESGAKGSKT